MHSLLWMIAAKLSIPDWLSLSWPARLVEKWLTNNYELQTRALEYVPKDTKTIMDLGVGGGVYLKRCKVPIKIGLDINYKRLKLASRYCSLTAKVDIREGIPRLSNIDCILCFELLEHLEKEEGVKLLVELEKYPVVVLTTPRIWFPVGRNSHEAHKSYWSPSNLAEFGYQLAAEMAVPPSNIYIRRRE